METPVQGSSPPVQQHDLPAAACGVSPGETPYWRHETVQEPQLSQHVLMQELNLGSLQDCSGDTPLQEHLPSEQRALQTPDLFYSVHDVIRRPPEGQPRLPGQLLYAQEELLGCLGRFHLEQGLAPNLEDPMQTSGKSHESRGNMAPNLPDGCMPISLHGSANARQHIAGLSYPESLPTEEPPRRRAISLPGQLPHITEVSKEMEERDSLLHCCKMKKRVKFADSLGLCLASVKHFLSSDDPLVPPEVLGKLKGSSPTESSPSEDVYWEQAPQAPAPSLQEREARLQEQRVCLEHASLSTMGIRGSVLLREPGDGVQVIIRYTFNEWLSYMECSASPHVPIVGASQPLAPGVQRFIFNMSYPPTTSLLHFAICCNTGHGQQLWDNNQNSNYSINCHPEVLQVIQDSDSQQESLGAPRHW